MIEILEMSAGLRLPLFLLDNGPSNITQLKRGLKASQQAIYGRLDGFEANGIIERERKTGYPGTVTVSLTERGVKIAEGIKDLLETVADVI